MIDEVRGATCRWVCTPWRSQKRHWTLPAVVRVAGYAVRDGADPCELAKAVAKAVKCECGKCEEEAAALRALIQEILEAQEALEEALDALRGDLEITPRTLQYRRKRNKDPKDSDGDAWYRALFIRFRRLFTWLFVLVDVARVIDAAEGMEALLGRVIAAQDALLKCVERGESE